MKNAKPAETPKTLIETEPTGSPPADFAAMRLPKDLNAPTVAPWRHLINPGEPQRIAFTASRRSMSEFGITGFRKLASIRRWLRDVCRGYTDQDVIAVALKLEHARPGDIVRISPAEYRAGRGRKLAGPHVHLKISTDSAAPVRYQRPTHPNP